MSVPGFYVTCYDNMGQRRLTASEQEEDAFTIHEFARDGGTIVNATEGSLVDVTNIAKEIGANVIVLAPLPNEVAVAFTNRFYELLSKKLAN